jgi:hypothetical protein
MDSYDIIHQRLHNQHISYQTFTKPEEIVRHLGAVQAQDYPGAKWSVGMRLLDATDDYIEQAFTAGAILRTHLMRPTWHFVVPDDIRWLLALTAPRVHAANAYQYRHLELGDATLSRANDVIEEALQGGKQLTRPELEAVLEQSGIPARGGLRSGYIMMHAELDGIICSGARRGKQFTYALLDERAPNARKLEHGEALAELTTRYFSGHGPAKVHDFVWWSGLTVSDAKIGIEMVKSELAREVVNGETYWYSRHSANTPIPPDISQRAYLLATYDEYGIGYKDRKDILDPEYAGQADPSNIPGTPFYAQIAMDDKITGFWKRTLKKREVVIETYLFRPLSAAETHAFAAEIERYGQFLGLPATLLP